MGNNFFYKIKKVDKNATWIFKQDEENGINDVAGEDRYKMLNAFSLASYKTFLSHLRMNVDFHKSWKYRKSSVIVIFLQTKVEE